MKAFLQNPKNQKIIMATVSVVLVILFLFFWMGLKRSIPVFDLKDPLSVYQFKDGKEIFGRVIEQSEAEPLRQALKNWSENASSGLVDYTTYAPNLVIVTPKMKLDIRSDGMVVSIKAGGEYSQYSRGLRDFDQELIDAVEAFIESSK